MDRQIVIGGAYKHFKGSVAYVITIAKHSETNEELNISLPKYVVGDVRCPNLVSTKGLERLEVVTNDLSLPKLDSKLASLKEVWGYDTAGILDKKQDKKM